MLEGNLSPDVEYGPQLISDNEKDLTYANVTEQFSMYQKKIAKEIDDLNQTTDMMTIYDVLPTASTTKPINFGNQQTLISENIGDNAKTDIAPETSSVQSLQPDNLKNTVSTVAPLDERIAVRNPKRNILELDVSILSLVAKAPRPERDSRAPARLQVRHTRS